VGIHIGTFSSTTAGSRLGLSTAGLVAGGLVIGGIFFPPLFIAAATVGASASVGSIARWYACRKVESKLVGKEQAIHGQLDSSQEQLSTIVESLEDLEATPELKEILEDFQRKADALCEKVLDILQSVDEGMPGGAETRSSNDETGKKLFLCFFFVSWITVYSMFTHLVFLGR
jgi:hypothetical protein